jgi:hypothetical protein
MKPQHADNYDDYVSCDIADRRCTTGVPGNPRLEPTHPLQRWILQRAAPGGYRSRPWTRVETLSLPHHIYTTSGTTLPLLPVGNTDIFVTLIHTLPPRPMKNTIVLVTLFCTHQNFKTLMLIPVQYPNRSVSAITLISLPKQNTPGEVLIPFPGQRSFHFRYNTATT